ncbi:MAG: alpha/beta hydrolase [Chloroflexales bacterium]
MHSTIQSKYDLHVAGTLNAAETLVFAHGYGSNQEAWRFVTPAFQERYRLVLFDLVGCGGSDHREFDPTHYASLHAYATDLIHIADSLKLTGAHLIAHSVSSMIGTLAALKRPDLFASMVCIGASPRYLNDDGYVGGFSRAAVDDLLDQMAQRFVEWTQGFASTVMGVSDQPELVKEFAQSLASMRPDIAICIATRIFLSDHRQDAARLTLPVLLMQPREDPVVPIEVSLYLHRVIAGSQLHWLSVPGHFPHLVSPTEVIDAIEAHLQRVR